MSFSDSEDGLRVSPTSSPHARGHVRMSKRRYRTQSSTLVNEIEHRPVDDVTLEAFYKPHNITLLVIAVFSVVAMAFVRCVGRTPE